MHKRECTFPVCRYFLDLTNLVEHNLVVARLVSAGSLPAEAEQTIALRKAAFNKALREYKNEYTQNTNQNGSKKSTRQSKQAKNQSSQHDY